LLGEAIREAIEPRTKSSSEAIATIYNNLHGNKAATRMTIRLSWSSAKCPNFDEVKAVE
jgi:hypothetical protein